MTDDIERAFFDSFDALEKADAELIQAAEGTEASTAALAAELSDTVKPRAEVVLAFTAAQARQREAIREVGRATARYNQACRRYTFALREDMAAVQRKHRALESALKRLQDERDEGEEWKKLT